MQQGQNLVVVVLDLKSVELRHPSSEDRMSLIVPSDPVLPVAAHAEASPDLIPIPVVCEFLDIFLKIFLCCH